MLGKVDRKRNKTSSIEIPGKLDVNQQLRIDKIHIGIYIYRNHNGLVKRVIYLHKTAAYSTTIAQSYLIRLPRAREGSQIARSSLSLSLSLSLALLRASIKRIIIKLAHLRTAHCSASHYCETRAGDYTSLGSGTHTAERSIMRKNMCANVGARWTLYARVLSVKVGDKAASHSCVSIYMCVCVSVCFAPHPRAFVACGRLISRRAKMTYERGCCSLRGKSEL